MQKEGLHAAAVHKKIVEPYRSGLSKAQSAGQRQDKRRRVPLHRLSRSLRVAFEEALRSSSFTLSSSRRQQVSPSKAPRKPKVNRIFQYTFARHISINDKGRTTKAGGMNAVEEASLHVPGKLEGLHFLEIIFSQRLPVAAELPCPIQYPVVRKTLPCRIGFTDYFTDGKPLNYLQFHESQEYDGFTECENGHRRSRHNRRRRKDMRDIERSDPTKSRTIRGAFEASATTDAFPERRLWRL